MVRSIAAIYDLHGNLPALEAVLAAIRIAGVERVIVGGDVLPGPMPRECLQRLRALDLPVDFLSGNGEREVLVERAGGPTSVPPQYRDIMQWSAQQVDDATARWLAAWPATVRWRVDGLGDVLFCHATPRSDVELFTAITPSAPLVPVFDAAAADVVVCGHTHMQFDRQIGGARVVNAGSAGMPFGSPGADWLLLDPDVRLQHTDYDLEAAAARIRRTGYPQADAFAEQHVLHPPAAQQMLELYERATRWAP